MFTIASEDPAEEFEVEYLYDTCFAPGRTALSSYRLREDVPRVAELCLTARDETGALAGAIRYWPIRIGRAGHPAVLLGPVAVHPTHQGEGLGALLIAQSLDRARELGWKRVVLVGDASYYNRFGFRRYARLRYPPPTNPDRLLAQSLVKGGMRGVTGMVRKWSSAG